MKSFQSLRIVLMGTPEFAVASLDPLAKAGFQIVGVITAPDKTAGRVLHVDSRSLTYKLLKEQ